MPSAPIVIKDDPTLMFTNAGMNQFKSYFLGNEVIKDSRVADSQTCLRVSGKHNDLEEVGRDHYHHTMFEMLGNWSFGDYFKEEAIDYAWDLLVNVYGLDSERLYVSVFEGDEELGLGLDEEAQSFWGKHVSADRILAFDRKDNFWEMGETGPCGPCSEVHIDLRSDEERGKVDGASLVNKDHPEVIEIWNLVFMQFNHLENGTLEPLASKHIDTGMGLERIVRSLQKVDSNYDIDLFKDLIHTLEKLSGKEYTRGEGNKDVAFRVIADHVRAVSFAIADGQLPSNTGAGYVIRRILRRAVRYGYSQLGMHRPFMFDLAAKLVDLMGSDYPRLAQSSQLITKVLKEEETTFLRTLEKGLVRLETSFKSQSTSKVIDGKTAFELYDTYGFPIDLTQLIADEQGFEVDMKGFEAELNIQKERSRKAGKSSYGDWTILDDGLNSVFLGYEEESAETKVAKYRSANVKGKQITQVVLKQTPFYAESGGQVGDKGELVISGESYVVFDTKKENGEIVHYLKDTPQDFTLDVTARVDSKRRNEIKKNHSATHLLHYVLRDILGDHVEQKGSLVDSNKLRFDFSHFEKVSEETLAQIERDIQSFIRSNTSLEDWRDMDIDEARSRGAMALFGEKYGDKVRVVKFGDSIELCGGTHVENTSEIEGVKLVSESSVASGIRRIEAITGKAYNDFVVSRLEQLDRLEKMFAQQKDIEAQVSNLIEHNAALKKELESLRRKELDTFRKSVSEKAVTRDGYAVIIENTKGIEPKDLKDMVFTLISEREDLLCVALGEFNDKPTIVVGVSKKLAEQGQFDARKIVNEMAQHISGGGGGQAFLAMAGGKNKNGLDKAHSLAQNMF